MKFRKKPVVIDAIRLNVKDRAATAVLLRGMGIEPGSFSMPVVAGKACWWRQTYPNGPDQPPSYSLIVPTDEGEMEAKDGDWIIMGVEGEIYPCRNSVFEATYEPA